MTTSGPPLDFKQFCETRRRAFVTLALRLVTAACRLAPPPARAIPAQRLQSIRTAAVAKKGFPDFDTFPLEGSAAAAAAMTDTDKRKAEEALEGAPAKKGAPGDKPLSVNAKRVRQLRRGAAQGDGPVIYWCAADGVLPCFRCSSLHRLQPIPHVRRQHTQVVFFCCRMSRDQRVRDNWALLHAAAEASKRGVPVAVAFNLVRGPSWYHWPSLVSFPCVCRAFGWRGPALAP